MAGRCGEGSTGDGWKMWRRIYGRWLEDVEKDLQEMKVKRRRQKKVDKEEWASVIKEARVVRGQ